MKIIKKLTSVICSAAVLLSLFTAVSISPAAAAAAASSPSAALRVEGQKSTIYSGSVDFTKDTSAYDILAAALASKNIPLAATKSSYGHYITAIGGESGTYPVYWHFYINGKSSDVGADSYKPADGDEMVFYLGDDSAVLYPTITITPKAPVAGQKAVVNVSATYTDYSDNSAVKTVKISGAAISLAGKTYTTDANGDAELTMPAAGSYAMTAVKETKDTTAAIVRTGKIPVTVAADPAASRGGKSGNAGSSPAKKTVVTAGAVNAAIKSGSAYILKSGINDWNAAVAYSASGRSVPQSFLSSVKDDIASGSTAIPVHLAGVILGIKAAGGNPLSFNGSNLVAQLYGSAKLGKTGLNGYTYGLLALDCGNYAVPSNAPVSRQKIIASILSYQKPNGAFALSKNAAADIDMTSIAVTALAPYTKQGAVKTAVNAAVAYLSKAQKKDGGFLPSYSTSEASESASQVIIALSSVGIDAQRDRRFIKKGGTLLAALMKYKKANGGFAHTLTGSSDSMATNQAVTALAAYNKYKSSGKRIYNMTAISAVKVKAAAAAKVANPDTGGSGSDAAGIAAVISVSALAVLALSKKRRLGK